MHDRLTTLLRLAAILAREHWRRGRRLPRGTGPADVLLIPDEGDEDFDVWDLWIDYGGEG